MKDHAGYLMATGRSVATARAAGCNDNMKNSHSHPYFEIYYLEEGQRYHWVRDQIYHLTAPALIVFPPHTLHHSYGGVDVRFKRVVIYFSPDLPGATLACQHLCQEVTVYQLQPAERTHLDVLVNALLESEKAVDEYTQEYRQAVVTQLLITLIRHGTAELFPYPATQLGSVISYLHERHHTPVTLDELARRFRVSKFHLCREFKKATGRTVISYLTDVRIGHASRLLQETHDSITDISRAVGFSNLSHFNRVFREHTGLSPSAYRNHQPGVQRPGAKPPANAH